MNRVLGLAIATITLALPSIASAGTYEVVACSGSIGNASWAAQSPTGWVTAYTQCPGEGIVTRMAGRSDRAKAPLGATARQVFTAAPNTAVVGFRADVKQNSANGWHAGLLDATPRWIYCGANCSTWGAYVPLNFGMFTSHVIAQVTCYDGNGCPTSTQDGYVAMRNVVVTLQDNVAPGVAITGGSVTASGWRRGNQSVQYSASDSTGMRSVELYVDDQLAESLMEPATHGSPVSVPTEPRPPT